MVKRQRAQKLKSPAARTPGHNCFYYGAFLCKQRIMGREVKSEHRIQFFETAMATKYWKKVLFANNEKVFFCCVSLITKKKVPELLGTGIN